MEIFDRNMWMHNWALLQATEGPLRWALGLLVALLCGGCSELLLRYLFRVLKRFAATTTTQYDDHLVARLRVPARLVALAYVLHLGALVAQITWPINALILIEWLLLTFILVETSETLLVDLVLEDRLGIKVPALLRQVVTGVLYAGVVLAVLGHVSGMDVTPLLATTSVVSLVLGLALQQPLSNLFAGLILHFDRPFKESDWILVNGREGRIEDVGWRSTRLRTLSGDILVLPNNVLLSAEIQNFSVPTTHTARNVELLVSPEVPPRALSTWVTEELSGIEGVLMTPPPKIWLIRLEMTAHRYMIKFWVEDFARHDDLESEFLKAMWYRLKQEGISLTLETPIRLANPPSDTLS